MGPIAVEDILPGDRVITGDGSMEEVIWKGNVTIVPGLKHVQKRDMRLTRFTPDSLGMSRPMSSIICGPSARKQIKCLFTGAGKGQAMVMFI